jgi:hypothetical protein
MSSRLITPGEATQSLIDPAYDKYLDSPPTRRELQATFAKIADALNMLMDGLDTQALVGNFLCDKQNVTRDEINVYVAKVAEGVKAQQTAFEAAQKAQQGQPAQAVSDAQSNV